MIKSTLCSEKKTALLALLSCYSEINNLYPLIGWKIKMKNTDPYHLEAPSSFDSLFSNAAIYLEIIVIWQV